MPEDEIMAGQESAGGAGSAGPSSGQGDKPNATLTPEQLEVAAKAIAAAMTASATSPAGGDSGNGLQAMLPALKQLLGAAAATAVSTQPSRESTAPRLTLSPIAKWDAKAPKIQPETHVLLIERRVSALRHTPQEAAELLIDSCPPEMQEQLLQVCERERMAGRELSFSDLKAEFLRLTGCTFERTKHNAMREFAQSAIKQLPKQSVMQYRFNFEAKLRTAQDISGDAYIAHLFVAGLLPSLEKRLPQSGLCTNVGTNRGKHSSQDTMPHATGPCMQP
jgi:hypothetical protein